MQKFYDNSTKSHKNRKRNMADKVLIVDDDISICKLLEKVTIPSSVIKIESDVFSKCPELKEIFIPESVTEIDPYAFYMSENVTIYTPAGSYAESFAIENNIPYVNQ